MDGTERYVLMVLNIWYRYVIMVLNMWYLYVLMDGTEHVVPVH